MAATAATGKASLAVEEARLARAAAAGDGSAFAELYGRYERRAYNLAYRVTGSEDDAADATQEAFLNVMRRLPKLLDRDLAFGSYLFTATRNACYDLLEKQRRVQPSDAIAESAAPVGAGGTPSAPDPGDPEEDPDRRVLLESQQEEIREANQRLPERQREALALRELEELSYDDIAEIMEMNRNSVAQLISRARINLRDELRGTAFASIAAASPDCERALPLLASREDGEMDDESDDAAWLDSHLAGCDRCRLGREAMQEAGASYRAWLPIAVAPWLLRETMAAAAQLTGSDWNEAIAEATTSRRKPGSLPGMPAAYRVREPTGGSSRRRRATAAALGIAALLLAGGLAAVLGDDDAAIAPTQPASESRSPSSAGDSSRPRDLGEPEKAAKPPATPSPTPEEQAEPLTSGQAGEAPQPVAPPQGSAGRSDRPARPGGRPGGSGGSAGLKPTRATSNPSRPPAELEPEPPAPEEPPTSTEPPREPPPERTPEEPRVPGVPPGAGSTP